MTSTDPAPAPVLDPDTEYFYRLEQCDEEEL